MIDAPLSSDAGATVHGSMDQPIVVLEKRIGGKRPKYIEWEYDKMASELGYFRLDRQSLHATPAGRQVDRMAVHVPNGDKHVFYFDVTEQLDLDLKRIKGGVAALRAKGALPPEIEAELKKDDEMEKRKEAPGN